MNIGVSVGSIYTLFEAMLLLLLVVGYTALFMFVTPAMIKIVYNNQYKEIIIGTFILAVYLVNIIIFFKQRNHHIRLLGALAYTVIEYIIVVFNTLVSLGILYQECADFNKNYEAFSSFCETLRVGYCVIKGDLLAYDPRTIIFIFMWWLGVLILSFLSVSVINAASDIEKDAVKNKKYYCDLETQPIVETAVKFNIIDASFKNFKKIIHRDLSINFDEIMFEYQTKAVSYLEKERALIVTERDHKQNLVNFYGTIALAGALAIIGFLFGALPILNGWNEKLLSLPNALDKAINLYSILFVCTAVIVFVVCWFCSCKLGEIATNNLRINVIDIILNSRDSNK
ncbi:MAG: hypothetical protein Q4E64_02080 [Phascolarctobacterium sp.]|uniref:hypothetical protein n=1 Tax=Phascolarctobacterium sp. TaxID=2049039 RepID=UPI0026DD6A62|nr:hypothetical protein [Phascolarctobacterium sp.]MDO4920604.1 hypothetical protein [Phascolarctobacterium sp.]